MRVFQHLASFFRGDGWGNTLSGLGGKGSRAEANKFSDPDKLTPAELLALYDGNWLARAVVEIYPNQALRKPLIVDAKKLQNFQRLNYPSDNRYPAGVFKHALNMGDLCGGAAVVLGVVGSGSPLEAPLPISADGTINAGDVAFFEVLTRFQLESKTVYDTPDDPMRNKRTEIWKVKSGRLKDLLIHESRLVFFEGATKVNLTDEQEDRDWPWQSVLQSVNEVLGAYGISWVSVGHLIQESSMAWLRMRGLVNMLTTESKAEVDARMDLLSTGRNVARTIFLDAGDGDGNGEEFGRTSVSFSDLPALLQEMALVVCAAVGAPATRLFGRAPAGMNATGESDERNFNDRCEDYRTNRVRPKLDRLIRAAEKNAVEYEFAPMAEPTAKEAAELRTLRANADQTWFALGALDPDQIIESRALDGTFEIKADWAKIIKERASAQEGPKININPESNAKAITVNEIRTNQGKGPLLLPGTTTPDPDGDLPLFVYEMKKSKEIEAQFAATQSEQTNGNDPNATSGEGTQNDPSAPPATKPPEPATQSGDPKPG